MTGEEPDVADPLPAELEHEVGEERPAGEGGHRLGQLGTDDRPEPGAEAAGEDERLHGPDAGRARATGALARKDRSGRQAAGRAISEPR